MRDWAAFIGLPLWFWLFILPVVIAVFCKCFSLTAKRILSPLWRLLDKIYVASGVVAAVFMIMILVIIILQMIARWSGFTFPGSTEYAGYAMAATSFFAFAYALNRGAHIRVSVLLDINNFTRKWVDAFAMLIAAAIATYFARYAIKTNFLSEMLNDRTQGQDQVPEWLLTLFNMITTSPTSWMDMWNAAGDQWVYTPVWLPQLPMSIGTTLLAIALWDNLYRLLINGETSIRSEQVE